MDMASGDLERLPALFDLHVFRQAPGKGFKASSHNLHTTATLI